jgi:hypothetical protein
MNRDKPKLLKLVPMLLFTALITFFAFGVQAENIDPDNDGSQYAWGENVGWINLEPSQGEGVTVTDSAITGKAWGENIGWINLSPATDGVLNDGAGNLSGYAWGENIGWISFSCENTGICNSLNYGVTINPATGAFSGKAWGENIGWINFAPDGKPVKTSWRGLDLITVTVPNGGDVLPSGGTYAICWKAPTSIQKFDLKYSIDNGANWNLINTVTGLNCIKWDVPVVTQNKKQCLVKAIGYDSNGGLITEDTSDKPFTIEVVRVTSPNGGETLKTGNKWTIKWVTYKTIHPVAKTVLQYTTNGTTWNPIKTLIGNPGNYTWTVPAVSSTKCKVKVILKDAGGTKVGTDISNKVFTIGP